mmetsp:Transcript_48683/g.93147  ORF Transcript_48683/g.93147 Transcript_48683/m.93147 type:complete len:332 (+) Transcript_48683:797-1792(+)
MKASTLSEGTETVKVHVGVMYMVLLALQYGLQPMLTTKFTPPTANKLMVVLLQEAAKAACAVTVMSSQGHMRAFLQPSRLTLILYAAALPAGIYCVQNWSTQVAYQALDSVTFNCLNQTKLVSTALCVYLLSGKKQSRMQMLALLMLVVSALLLQADGPSSSSSTAATTASQTAAASPAYHQGIVAILGASMLSGLASAVSQQSLQRMSGFELTLGMCIVSTVLLLGGLALSSDASATSQKTWLEGLELAVAIPICTNAAGGILVGQVTKHMGGVSKGFSVVFGLVISGIVQSILNNTMLPVSVAVALVTVSAATAMHTCFPPMPGKLKAV